MAEPPGDALASDRVIATTLDEVIARRASYLVSYQNSAYAQRYRTLVDRVRAAEHRLGRGSALAEAVARNHFKLLAIKDEYEVARLYTDGEFERQVAGAFEGGYRIAYHFAPPLWAKADPVTGVPRKRRYGPWVRPLLAIVARLKFLRGSTLDVFGHTDERRRERRLIGEYEALVDEIVRTLDADNLALAVELASLPASIRGYGHVKANNLEAVKAREASLLERYRRPVERAVALAAD
jgi:indolepyruvate ferredoxin oxidoreductase